MTFRTFGHHGHWTLSLMNGWKRGFKKHSAQNCSLLTALLRWIWVWLRSWKVCSLQAWWLCSSQTTSRLVCRWWSRDVRLSWKINPRPSLPEMRMVDISVRFTRMFAVKRIENSIGEEVSYESDNSDKSSIPRSHIKPRKLWLSLSVHPPWDREGVYASPFVAANVRAVPWDSTQLVQLDLGHDRHWRGLQSVDC